MESQGHRHERESDARWSVAHELATGHAVADNPLHLSSSRLLLGPPIHTLNSIDNRLQCGNPSYP